MSFLRAVKSIYSNYNIAPTESSFILFCNLSFPFFLLSSQLLCCHLKERFTFFLQNRSLNCLLRNGIINHVTTRAMLIILVSFFLHLQPHSERLKIYTLCNIQVFSAPVGWTFDTSAPFSMLNQQKYTTMLQIKIMNKLFHFVFFDSMAFYVFTSLFRVYNEHNVFICNKSAYHKLAFVSAFPFILFRSLLLQSLSLCTFTIPCIIR